MRKLGMAAVFLWFACFALLPVLLLFVISFTTAGTQHLILWQFTFKNYEALYNSIFLRIFLHSFEFAIACTLLTLVLAYPAAYVISSVSTRFKSTLLMLMIIPFWTSSLIRTYAIMALLKTKGVINTALLAMGIIHKPLLMLYTDTAMLIGLAYNLLPYMILPLYSNFEKLDHRIYEAAQDLGASRWQLFSRITIPLTMPGIMMGVLFVFLPAMTIFYIPNLLGGARGVLLGNLVKEQFVTMNDWPGGAATSIILTVFLLMMLSFYRHRVRHGHWQELV
ncbi:MAG: spermidine/putrescine ABC transporter permease [Coxiella sp. (in: Bacteria)]|nr:MAG: spermidine/putrescine ABC transporter permease [Coxiella sp. (in: g-proteobacteria)]